MTFKDVVVKNFKYNFKTYSSFYICSTFTITLFFIFTTLFYNEKITSFLDSVGTGADTVPYIALIATFIFGILFISYVHASMKKSRSKEFGLLMTLGMTSKDLGKLIIIEDIILSSASIISGILVGTLFSRLVHMFINKLMDLNVPYSLSYKSFILTFCSFFIIFTLVIIIGWIKTKRLQISKLLREQRKTEYSGDGSIFALIISCILIAFLIVISNAAIKNRDIALNFKITISAEISGLLGIYIMIVNLYPKLLHLIKKRKSIYNKNMIVLSEVKYSMSKNKKLIYMSAILCTVIIYSFSSSVGLFSIIDDIMDSSKGADVEYIQSFNINNFSEEKMGELISKNKLTLKSKEDINCLFLNVNGMKLDYNLPVIAISNSDYNKLSKNKTDVPKGGVRLTGDAINLPKVNGSSVNINLRNSTEKLSVLKPESLSILTMGMYIQYKFTMILNDEDYNRLQTLLPKTMEGEIHKYNFGDWRKTKNLLYDVSKLSQSSKNIKGKTGIEDAFNVSGNYYQYEMMKKLYSMFIFIFMFLSILFYVASVLMLFLRQFEALERTKRKYIQLRKIGITRKEFGKTILGEMRIIFLTPVVFGIILGYCLMLITEGMVGGGSLVKVFMKNTVILTSIYILLQMTACEWSGRVFLNRVTEKELLH